MRIENGLIYEKGSFTAGKSLCTSGQLISSQSNDETVIDARGGYVIPGLIDLHFHGCNGVDFCDGTVEAIEKIASYELLQGVTTIHPATMTLSEDTLIKISKAAKQFHNRQLAEPVRFLTEAELAGIYMEGPFISMEKRGAQNPEFIRKPDLNLLERLQEASGGLYKISVVAPEVEGAMEYITEAAKKIRVSLAHTNADYDIACSAFLKGASLLTHAYNAMPAFLHREPGVIGAACDHEEAMVEMICDGIHLHPATIRTSFKMFGNERIIMISDSMMATGLQDGIYSLGEQEVQVHGNLATLVTNGAIAGSVTHLFDCLKYVVKEAGIPLETVVPCVTENPAKAIGIDKKTGSLTIGKFADILILDQNLCLQHILHKGILIR